MAHREGWGYTGAHGHSHWPEMFHTCLGDFQSPIDIDTSETEYDSTLGEFHTTNFDTTDGIKWELINNGHTVQVALSYSDEGHAVKVSGGGLDREYIVVQFHFHWGGDDTKGSEYLIDGHAYPMEFHIVAYNTKYDTLGEALSHKDGLAVLAFFGEVSSEDNPEIQKLVDHFDEIHEPHTSTSITPFKLDDIVPDMHDYYRLQGSLTTPPCNEVVTWSIFTDTLAISETQLEAFRHVQDSHHHDMVDNFRPSQDLKGRTVYKSFQ